MHQCVDCVETNPFEPTSTFLITHQPPSSMTETLSLSRVFTAVAAAGAVGFLGYLVYFDYRRQTDPEFRRKLRAQRSEANRIVAQRNAEVKASAAAAAQARRAASAGAAGAPIELEDEPVPTTAEGREAYFNKHLVLGENLLGRGPAGFEAAAVCFFRAIKVYPEPMNLLMILQQSLPEPVLNMIVELMAADSKKKQDSYNSHFPAQSMNVAFVEEVQRTKAGGGRVIRRGLAVTKDMAAGETIFVENPLVASCDLSSDEIAASCAHCLKALATQESGDRIVCDDCDGVVYCSAECKTADGREHHKFMCTGATATGSTAASFAGLCKAEGDLAALMSAKFLTKMVDKEMGPDAKGELYTDWDHLERMYAIKQTASDKERLEAELIKQIVGPAVNGFEAFLTVERYMTVKSKIIHNAIAIPSTDAAPDASAVRVKSASPTSPPKGAGLYHIATYISHSCAPNAALRFAGDRGSQVAVVALEDIKAGSELFVSFVDPAAAYEQRKEAIRSAYGFVCKCTRCSAKA
ncbi:MAS20 protein import receptor-domain-containing protein [Entophlyctis helioformis]|nr:MAS20 protein import receptor-domain-containing protein [Entophlyctis helioformis]